MVQLRSIAAAVVLASACGGSPKPTAAPVLLGGGPGSDPGRAAATGEPATPPAPAPAPPPLPAPPADLGRADLVTLHDGTVTAYAIDGGKLVELGHSALATVDAEDYTAQLSGDWADHDHLFVLIPARDVLMITADAITRVPVLPPDAFKTPRPKVDDDENLTEGGVMEGAGDGLVLGEGAAWWVECPWGFPYDGWQCEVVRKAQLWPTAAATAEDGLVGHRAWDWADVKVSGFRTKEVDDGHGLACTPPASAHQKTAVFRSDVDGEQLFASHWLSASPPRLLVIYGQFGLADLYPSRWELHDGCAPTPLVQGVSVEPGPAGLWLAGEATDPGSDGAVARWVLRRGADVLGELPTDDVMFRPPAATR